MTDEEYFKQPYLHYSDLCLIAHSYEYYEYIKSIPPEMKPDTDAMKFGRAYDTFMLKQDEFYNEWFVIKDEDRPEPEKTFTSTANKNWKKQIESEYPGKFITGDEFKKLERMYWQLTHHPAAKLFVTPDGIPQNVETFDLFNHKFTSKHDIFYPNKQLIVDLKTTISVNPKNVLNSIIKYRYYLQEYIYRQGVYINYGYNPNFLFIFQEKSAPYDCLVVDLDYEWQVKAEGEIKHLLSIYDKHQNNPNLFKGISESIYNIEMPEYLTRHTDIEEEETEFEEEEILFD